MLLTPLLFYLWITAPFPRTSALIRTRSPTGHGSIVVAVTQIHLWMSIPRPMKLKMLWEAKQMMN